MVNPTIPMSPDALPQQNLYSVVDIPPRPHKFTVKLPEIRDASEDTQDPWRLPETQIPDRFPGRASYLFQAEWNSSPVHNWIYAYYVASNRKRTHWFLWRRYLNDSGPRWRWESVVYAYAPRVTHDRHTAAIWLLALAWRAEVDLGWLEMPDWIGETASLSVSEVKAIYRFVGWTLD